MILSISAIQCSSSCSSTRKPKLFYRSCRSYKLLHLRCNLSRRPAVPFAFIIRTQIHSVRKLISNLAPNGLELTLHTPQFGIPSAIDIDGLYGYSRICWHATSGKRRNNKNNHIQMRTNKLSELPPSSPPRTDWQFAPIAHHPSDVLIWKIQSDYNLNALSSERANERVFKADMSTQRKWFEQFCLSKGINAIN